MRNHFCELKLAPSDTGEMSFSGYGAVFGNIDSYGDVIQPGAFADTLAASKQSNQWPAMLLQHGGFLGAADDMTPIGSILFWFLFMLSRQSAE